MIWRRYSLPPRYVELRKGFWREVMPLVVATALELDLASLSPGCTVEDVVRIAVACGRLPGFRFEAAP